MAKYCAIITTTESGSRGTEFKDEFSELVLGIDSLIGLDLKMLVTIFSSKDSTEP